MIRFTADGKVDRDWLFDWHDHDACPEMILLIDALDIAVAALRHIHDHSDTARVDAADALRQIGAII